MLQHWPVAGGSEWMVKSHPKRLLHQLHDSYSTIQSLFIQSQNPFQNVECEAGGQFHLTQVQLAELNLINSLPVKRQVVS